MPYFHFSQNNSGGSFDLTDTLTHNVVIEAHDAAHANTRLEELGGYFDGCAKDMDCDCCGDRWYRACSNEADDAPMVYGKPVSSDPLVVGKWMAEGKNAVVHHLDGRVEWY